MKKARIALIFISFLSVSAAALAYKANTIRLFFATGQGGNCDVMTFTNLAVTTTLYFGGFTTCLSTTKDVQNPCPCMSVRTIA